MSSPFQYDELAGCPPAHHSDADIARRELLDGARPLQCPQRVLDQLVPAHSLYVL